MAEERVGNLDQSQRTFSKSCDRGHPDSCREAGNISFRKNAKKIALSFWEKACVLKDGGACLKLSEGNGLELNPEKAAKYLRLSCLAGISHACQKLATVAKGKADRELVTAGKQKACAMGHAVECMALAQIHRVNGKRSLAKNYLEKACRYGETGSCIDQIIERRKVVRKDPSRRKKWLQYLCGSKDGGKCLSAANLLRERGLDWLALEAFQMACQLGEPNGCRILAKESRLKGNDKKFLSFSKKACSLGDGDACTEARRILKASPKTKSGRKSGPNEMDALLKTSCDNDSGKACYELGKIREEQGQKNKAKPLYQKACKLGFGWDCQNSEMAH